MHVLCLIIFNFIICQAELKQQKDIMMFPYVTIPLIYALREDFTFLIPIRLYAEVHYPNAYNNTNTCVYSVKTNYSIMSML